MPEHDDDSLRSPKRMREWILLAATVLGVLSNVGLHLVFTTSSVSPPHLQQFQTEMAERLKAEAELREQLIQMHEHEALMEMRIKYLEDRRR